MILAKIGITIIFVTILCVMWYVVGNVIGTVMEERKNGQHYSDSIPKTLVVTLLSLGVTLVDIYLIALLYTGGK